MVAEKKKRAPAKPKVAKEVATNAVDVAVEVPAVNVNTTTEKKKRAPAKPKVAKEVNVQAVDIISELVAEHDALTDAVPPATITVIAPVTIATTPVTIATTPVTIATTPVTTSTTPVTTSTTPVTTSTITTDTSIVVVDSNNTKNGDDDADDSGTEVEIFRHNGVTYLRDEEGALYDETTHEEVGFVNTSLDKVTLLADVKTAEKKDKTAEKTEKKDKTAEKTEKKDKKEKTEKKDKKEKTDKTVDKNDKKKKSS